MIQVHSLEELQTLQASREDNIVLLESMGFRKVAGVEEGTSKPHSVVALVANPHLFLDKFKAGYVDPSKSSYKPLIESDLSSSLIPSVELITDVARYLTPLLLKYTGNRTNIGRTLLFNRASPFPTPQKFYINILSPNDRDEGDVDRKSVV